MAEDFPGTLLDFEHWFRTEEACRDYLAKVRWPSGFRCPHCTGQQAWRTKRGLFHCTSCRSDTSVTSGTIFHKSHLSLRLWFRAMWLVTNQKGGVSALGMQRTLGLGSYKTAWACLHKLRQAMVRPGREQLSGQVEVDETFVGGHERGAGGRHLGKKSLVIIASEVRGKGTGRIRLRQIPNASRPTLFSFVQDTIAPGSSVITDGFPAYEGLERIGYGYQPRIPKEHRSEASVLLPRVHHVASLLKRWLLGVHHGSCSKQQLTRYLEEFTFRFNRRSSPKRGMLFYRLAQQAAVTGHTPFSGLVGKAFNSR